MNDLTKEAIRRQQQDWEIDLKTYMSSAHYGNALAQARPNIDPSFGRPKYGNDYLEPDRPLTGKPGDYLTGYEGSRCDRIDVPEKEIRQSSDYSHLPILDLDKFRKFCEEIGE